MKKRYIALLAVGLVAVIVGASLFGYGRWDNSRTFVSTGNAQVVADLIKVGAINSGRIIEMNVQEGDRVSVGDVIATLNIEAAVSTAGAAASGESDSQGVLERRLEVLSAPRSGVIVARWALEGDSVSADQPIVTLMDTSDLRVVANIHEGDVRKVRTRQTVEIKVASSGAVLTGRVDRISPVTKAALAPQQRSSNGSQQTPQVVPVRISLDDGHDALIPGSSADVKIRVR